MDRILPKTRGALLAATLVVTGLTGPLAAQLNCNAGVEFHANGSIKRCELNGHHRFYLPDGSRVGCADGSTAELYPDGKLERCRLLEPQKFDARPCEAGSLVELAREGRVRGCR